MTGNVLESVLFVELLNKAINTDPSTMKVCSKCGHIKPRTEFPKNKHWKDGLCYWCKDCTREGNRKSWWKFRDDRLLKSKTYQQSPKFIMRRRKTLNEKYKIFRTKVFNHYGNKCVKCGYDDERALCIDHVNGGGAKERRKFGGISLFQKIIKERFPSDYQLLCANCNNIKMYENKEFPGWSSKEAPQWQN